MASTPPRSKTPRTGATKAGGKVSAALACEAYALALTDASDDGFTATLADAAVDRIVQCFGLDAVERAALALLMAAEASSAVARRLDGGARLTVAGLRELLVRAGHAGLTARLTPTSPLRRHALVHVVDAVDRHVTSDDPIRLEVGLVPPLPLGSEWSAFHVSAPSAARATDARPGFAARASVRAPQFLHLDGSAPQGLAPIADALADQLSRRVVWCSAGAELDGARAARLRRDVDLDGAALVLRAPSEAVLRAVLVTPPTQAAAPSLVVVVDVSVDDRTAASPWVLRHDKIGIEQARGPALAASPLDYIRELAQRDADRALGIVRTPPKPRPVVPGQIVDAPMRVAVERPTVPVAVPASPEPEPQPEIKPAMKAEPKLETKSTPALTVGAEPIIVVAAPISEPADTRPRVEVPAGATPEMLARLAMQSPSAAQRVELMTELSGLKSPAVVAMLRHNVKSENERVRLTAERSMTQLFGQAWNKTRAIVPPVQPPSSEE